MLNVPDPSPPVPTTSIAPSGASTRSTRSRMAEANPASSSTVSPRIRRATSIAASWAGVASPSITAPIASRASSTDSVRPSTIEARAERTWSLIDRRPRWPRRRAQPPRGSRSAMPAVANEPLAASSSAASPSPAWRRKLASRWGPSGRQHALGVELHAFHRERRVAQAHHDPIRLAHRGDAQLVRQRRRIDAQRVVARRHERRRHALEQARAVMRDLGRLAVDERRCAHDRRAVDLRHRLHPEADAQQRNAALARDPDRVHRHAGGVGIARTGRDDDPGEVLAGVGGKPLDARPDRWRRCERP